MKFPKMRLLEYKPVIQENIQFLTIYDPLELSDKTLMIPKSLIAAIALIDGKHTIHEIVASLTLLLGIRIPINTIEEFIITLDNTFLLENERSDQAIQTALNAYHAAPYRPSCCAGRTYPEKQEVLYSMFKDLYEELGSSDRSDPEIKLSAHTEFDSVKGIISPHIDYQRGGRVYAQTWKQIKSEVRSADLVVLFGTDHYGSDLFTLTRQNYATPFGILQTDQRIVNHLAQSIKGSKAFQGELRHRTEHSIELATAWLQFTCLDGIVSQPPPIIPVLTGDFLNLNEEDFENLEQFILALRQATDGKKVLYIAAADLAHIGTTFGGESVDFTHRTQLKSSDEELLRIICSGDAEAFLKSIQEVNNRNNICGVGPIYLTLRMTQPTKGEIIAYDLCSADNQGTSIVSICGVVFKN